MHFFRASSNLLSKDAEEYPPHGNHIYKAGYLSKLGGSKGGRKNWKNRWFVLDDKGIWYYPSSAARTEQKPLGCMTFDRNVNFSDSLAFDLVSVDRTINVKCEDTKTKLEWVDALRAATEGNDGKTNPQSRLSFQSASSFNKVPPKRNLRAATVDATVTNQQKQQKEVPKHMHAKQLSSLQMPVEELATVVEEAKTNPPKPYQFSRSRRPTETCRDVLSHQLFALDAQFQHGLHVARRLASFMAKITEQQLKFVAASLELVNVEKKKTELLADKDYFGQYIDVGALLQQNVEQMLEKHKHFANTVNQDIVQRMLTFQRVKEEKRAELMNEHKYTSQVVSKGLATLQAARTIVRKEWVALCKEQNKLKPSDKEDAQLTEKERTKIQQKIQSKLIPSLKKKMIALQNTRDEVIPRQDAFVEAVLPKTIEQLEDMEKARLQLMEDVFAQFGELYEKMCLPGDALAVFKRQQADLEYQQSVVNLFSDWQIVHGVEPQHKKNKIEVPVIPCKIEDLSDDTWMDKMPTINLDEDSDDEDDGGKPSTEEKKKGLTDFIRGKVSKKKKRYQENGYDLDLSYITKSVIAMGFPAEGLSGQYRNNLKDVKRFLDQFHEGKYKLYNLCSELAYDENKFEGRVVRFGFDDHNPCALNRIAPFCRQVQEWLTESVDNLAAIHCKAGKGRTGFLISCFLLHLNEPAKYANSDEALMFFAKKRTFNAQGVTIPSQKRYVKYYELLLHQQRWLNSDNPDTYQSGIEATLSCGNNLDIPKSRPLKLRSVTVYGVPMNMSDNYFFTIQQPNMDDHKMETVYSSRGSDTSTFRVAHGQDYMLWTPKEELTGAEIDREPGLCVLDHDLKFKFMNGGKLDKSKDNCFHFWLNTRMLPLSSVKNVDGEQQVRIKLLKHEVDKARKDKHHSTYRENFAVELLFLMAGEAEVQRQMAKKNEKKEDESDVDENALDAAPVPTASASDVDEDGLDEAPPSGEPADFAEEDLSSDEGAPPAVPGDEDEMDMSSDDAPPPVPTEE